jgi:hypothetical protein
MKWFELIFNKIGGVARNEVKVCLPSYNDSWFSDVETAAIWIDKHIMKEVRYRCDVVIIDGRDGDGCKTNANLFMKVVTLFDYRKDKPYWWNQRAYIACSKLTKTN